MCAHISITTLANDSDDCVRVCVCELVMFVFSVGQLLIIVLGCEVAT